MSAGVRNQIDPAAWAPSDPARRRIEAADIAYARARRPRQGWQSLGLQLGLNAADLQRACEAVEASTAPPPKPPKLKLPSPPAPTTCFKPGGRKALILLAIAGGAKSFAEVRTAAGLSLDMVRFYTHALRAGGFIGYLVPGCGWEISDAGYREIAAQNAAEASAHG